MVLDAFCGTGAMGLEALSRGARHVHFMDNDPVSLESARQNIASLGVGDHTTVLPADATQPPPARQPCTLIFLDPPYGAGLAGPALDALAAGGWLAPQALCVVESGPHDPVDPSTDFQVLDARAYGKALLTILRFDGGGVS